MDSDTQLLQRVRVKMCGTTRLEDARAAMGYGVDALGFIFYSKSPRYIAPEKVVTIVRNLPPFIDRVGVFVNAPQTEVVRAAGCGLTYLQLHGDESVEYCCAIREMLPFCGVIKAFRVSEKSTAEEFERYNDCVDAFLLDTYVESESGGTGKVFDWSIIESLNLQRPLILAGGLAPENVAGALAAVRPYAVDINSGIEVEPGVKDHGRLKTLMQVVAQHACR
ncbi:MAG: N-(5'-phosphoribosyl)anthranilate isomerase [Desulfobulbaceae bacterium BRH_c16a]|nr:MAG: N-(5'-phosphoribosyl)anthranilate isomerase [Desulfobulbaceae bacterium BRH_c16a]